jgi:hypothetical protein
LVTGNQLSVLRGQLTFDNVKISTAYSASSHAQKDFTGSDAWLRNVADNQRVSFDTLR